MSGTLAITVRTKAGEIHRMTRPANLTYYFVHNVKFLSQDEAYLAEYIDQWQKMRGDWPHLGDSRENHNPIEVLAPQGYGLMVLDYQTNRILTCQLYFTVGEAWAFGDQVDDTEDGLWFTDLFTAGKLLSLKIRGRKERPVPADELSRVDLLTKIVRDRLSTLCHIDMSPWQVVNFPYTIDSWQQFRDECRSSFGLTENEEAVWQEWIANMERRVKTSSGGMSPMSRAIWYLAQLGLEAEAREAAENDVEGN